MGNPDITILLVEDNRVDALFLQKMLRTVYANPILDHVTTIREAIDRAERGRYDVILLDLYLPDSQGVDTVQRMHGAAADIPIVVLTAMDSAATAASTLREGARGYLVKHQLTTDIFLRAVHSAIAQHRRVLRIDARAQDENADLREVLEHAEEGLLILDANRVIRYANRQAEWLMGRRSTRLIGTVFEPALMPMEQMTWTPANPECSDLRVQLRISASQWQQKAGFLVTMATLRDEPLEGFAPMAIGTQEFPDTLCLFTPDGICLDVIPGAAAPTWLAETFSVGQSFEQAVPAPAADLIADAFVSLREDRSTRVFYLDLADESGRLFQVEAALRAGGKQCYMLTLRTQLVPVADPGDRSLHAVRLTPSPNAPRTRSRRGSGLSLIRTHPATRPDGDNPA